MFHKLATNCFLVAIPADDIESVTDNCENVWSYQEKNKRLGIVNHFFYAVMESIPETIVVITTNKYGQIATYDYRELSSWSVSC